MPSLFFFDIELFITTYYYHVLQKKKASHER